MIYDINSYKWLVKQYCVRGEEHFCDGAINYSVDKPAKVPKPPCLLRGRLCPVRRAAKGENK